MLLAQGGLLLRVFMIRLRKVPIALGRANPPAQPGNVIPRRELYRRRDNAGEVCARIPQVVARAKLFPLSYSENGKRKSRVMLE